MVTIGADLHKRWHTAVATDEQGRRLAEKTVRATPAGHLESLTWADRWPERRWALEDCRHLSRQLERDLLAAGAAVVRVSPRLMAGARRAGREPGKSDPIDALAVARAALREPALPVARLDGPERDVRLLVDHREDLVAERTRAQNRLRWHLHELAPGDEPAARSLDRRHVLAAIEERLAGLRGTVARIARELVGRVRELPLAIDRLERELTELTTTLAPALLALQGCGVLTAAKLVGETADVTRFRSAAAFARHDGTAPLPVWSGNVTRHRLSRGGNRQLNVALHRIAITQLQRPGRGQDYIAKRLAAGDTKTEAIRALRRHRQPGHRTRFPACSPWSPAAGPRRRACGITTPTTAPLAAPGSDCKTPGTEVVYDESIDKDPSAVDGGGGIDPSLLPLDPANGCSPVYPHQFLKVNTVFEVVREQGGRTAWADKHPAYELVNGPSGTGVQDLYTPEVASVAVEVVPTEGNDDLKVAAVLNQIDGLDHTGKDSVGVPSIFGMNFQAVSVAQKDAGGGYKDGQGTPSDELQQALGHTDASIGKMIDELDAKGLLDSTTVILTAKHGQSPIDPAKSRIIDKSAIPAVVDYAADGLVAQATQDDISLLWLTDQAKTAAAVGLLEAQSPSLGLAKVLSGDSLKLMFDDPSTDPRTPDIIGLPDEGVIYTKPTATKIAEHGGFSTDDTNVALVVAGPGSSQGVIGSPVETTQIAPTILASLGIDPGLLQAVQKEHTTVLPGIVATP